MIYVDWVNGDYFFYTSTGEQGYGYPNCSNHDIVLSQNSQIIELERAHGRQADFLSNQLGLPCSLDLYDIFSYYFDGKVSSDFEMLELIFNGLLKTSNYIYVLGVGVTYCIFTYDSRVKKQSLLQFSYTASKYTVGKFYKRLMFEVAKLGYRLDKIKYLFWGTENILLEEKSVFGKDLKQMLQGVEGLYFESVSDVIKELSLVHQLKYLPTADALVGCLDTLVKSAEKGVLTLEDVFYKDYSSCTANFLDDRRCSYGVIMDLEGSASGNISDGLSEVGGLVFKKYKDIMIVVDTFYSDRVLFVDTMKALSQNVVGNRVDVLVFGSTDKQMFLSTAESDCNQKDLKLLQRKFHFVDCLPYIYNVKSDLKVQVTGKQTLSNIAKGFNVKVVAPLHSPINDARTLFNVLAKCLQSQTSYNFPI